MSLWDGTLRIDVETYCETDLAKCGVYKYVQDPTFELQLFGYRFSGEPQAVCVDLAQGEELPERVLRELYNPRMLKVAWNAGFELATIGEYLRRMGKPPLDPRQWRDTMTRSLMVGLPASLKEGGKIIGTADEDRKDTAGRALVKYFCAPCKPTKSNGGRTRNLPTHEPEKWAAYKAYNIQDVVAEGAIDDILMQFPIDDREWPRWQDDVLINARGVCVDPVLVANAVAASDLQMERDLAELARITGVSNPKSVDQLKKWLEAADGEVVEALTKETVPELIANTSNETVKRALELRQSTSKSSVDKYRAMARAMGEDHRVRGLLFFYGANRTGRHAGRLVQVQNLKSNTLPDLDFARELLLANDIDTLEFMFGPLAATLSQLVRTAIVPAPGSRFVVADYSAIEARVLAWLAQEEWRLEVFRSHGRIYEASASQMFHVPWADFQAYIDRDKKHPLRKKGKVGELAFGYQGGVGAAIKMGALKEGLTEAELPDLVKDWRAASPAIASFDRENPGIWQKFGRAAFMAVKHNRLESVRVGPPDANIFVRFQMMESLGRRALYVWLPSGRPLVYWNARIRSVKNRFGEGEKEVVSYEGYTERGPWGMVDSYGGKFTENITQAVARDLLFPIIDKHASDVVFHVHDEVVLEVRGDRAKATLGAVLHDMAQTPAWARGLPLKGEGEILTYYRKSE